MNLPFSSCNPTRRDTRGGAARGERGLRRHEGARGGGNGEFLTACGGANGPGTRADLQETALGGNAEEKG